MNKLSKSSSSGFAFLELLIILVVFALLVLAGLWVYKKSHTLATTLVANNAVAQSPQSLRGPIPTSANSVQIIDDVKSSLASKLKLHVVTSEQDQPSQAGIVNIISYRITKSSNLYGNGNLTGPGLAVKGYSFDVSPPADSLSII